jgi:putative aldouronate transport system permease protein
VLVLKTFFEGLPEELNESARIDGAGEGILLTRIILPMSIPVMVTVGLFYLVSNWNIFFSAIFYITDPNLQPLQVIVRSILLAAEKAEMDSDITIPTTTLRMAAVIVASLPIIIVYPFLQKHLTKGMLIGALKG